MYKEIYYKVCFANGGKYISSYENEYSVEYILGKTTLPHPDFPDSKLFVFNNIDNAKKYRLNNRYMVIFECIATDVEVLEYTPYGTYRFDYWSDKTIGYVRESLDGTMVASSVTLTKKLEF